MSSIFDFLKGGVACAFVFCLTTGVLMLAGFILLVIFYPIVLKILKSKKETPDDSETENEESFFSRHLYKIFAAILFVDAVVICAIFWRERGVSEIISVSIIAYIASMVGGSVFYSVLLGLVCLIEKALGRYIELKKSIKQDFESSQIPMWAGVFVGFCIFAYFLP